MAKGGNDQRSNGSRFKKPHNTCNNFVTKVASRVSDYLGGWFGAPLKTPQIVEAAETPRSSGDTTDKRLFNDVEPRPWTLLSQGVFDDDIEAMSSPAKRFKISDKEKLDIDFPISPIPSTSGLFQNAVNHTFEMPKREDFGMSVAGPSTLPGEKFTRTNDIAPTTSSTTDVKANGAIDNHSDSSESTSGCSSLVPQSDRLSQSAYVCTNRKRNLEEKLKYARQLQQSRASMYLNRSIPVSEAPGGRKKPAFDVTVYGSPALDKSLLKEKLINSPFYTGQTSYGGASAYRFSRNTFYSQRGPCFTPERREGIQVQVKPSHHGSTEDLTNMSHTAKKILEALEQFSTPVNDAKRIPLSRNAPLGSKRQRFNELSETRLRLSTPISPLNPNPGPVITGLNVPTVPDLLKLKRLERIQNSTAAARQVAVQKQEYTLPSEPEKHTGKIVTKLKKKKDVPMEKLEEVNLPKISLPITTLPKFDFQLPAMPKLAERPETRSKFVFSPPIAVTANQVPDLPAQTKSFKSAEKKDATVKPVTGTWECGNCLLRNLNDSKICVGCKGEKADDKTRNQTKTDSSAATDPKPPRVAAEEGFEDKFKPPRVAAEEGFGDKFKPPPGTWSCKECFVRNNATDQKCIACEALNPTATATAAPPPKKEPEPPKPTGTGFGDKFKKKANEWECPDCMIRNKESDVKCIACEAAKPGTTPEKPEMKFKFGIDKSETEGIKSPADSSTKTQSNGPQPGILGISTSVGVFTFGIPPKKEEAKVESPKPAENSSSFLVTSTSGTMKKVDPEKPETKVEAVKPFTFGIPKSSKSIFGSSTEEKPKDEAPKFILGSSSSSGSLETVSSSTSDFNFGQVKSVDGAKSTFQFKSSIPPEAGNSAEVTKPESTVVSTSGPVSVMPSFVSSPIFNNSKITLGTTSTSFGFATGTGLQTTESPGPITSPSSFSATGLTPTPSFGAIPQAEKPPAENTFGASSFSGTPFAPAQNLEPAKPFSFGSSSTFGANPTPAPTLCSGFVQSNPPEKPAAFIFGAPAQAVTTAAASSGFNAPSSFGGASKPDSRPTFAFGQTNSAPSFNFGSNAPATNFFGTFRQSKPENPVGGGGLPFGGTGTGGFGQSSAPVAFEPATPKFVFGNSGNQQQQEAVPVFKFGAATAQPESAPASTGFSLSVPDKFNFSGGQTPAFSATPNADDSNCGIRKNRKVIKAVRRTARDPMRRPQ